MRDHIEAIIAGLENCCAECADQAEHIAYAINEHAEVVITTPADDAAHDAAVAARALRDAAEMWSNDDYIETALGGLDYVRGRLIDRADRIEREGGTSDA